MKTPIVCLLGCQLWIALAGVATTSAQEPAKAVPKKPLAAAPKEGAPKPAAPKESAPKPADPNSKEVAAIQQSSKAFIDAFNKGDAKGVAALWTPNGEYIDEQGARFEGRAAIEKEYAAFFAAHKGAKIDLAIDALRLASDTSAIEDGRSIIEAGPNAAIGHGRYTALHVKTDGKWLLSSVRDGRMESSSAAGQLQDLQWLIGSWVAEENGGKMEMNCRWIADKGFVERSYSVKRDDKQVSSGVQVIGWNPRNQSIQSWTFSSDGGHAVGVWIPRSNGWAIEIGGTMADGTPTRAVNLLTRIDDKAFSWQSIERSVAGIELPNSDEILLKRVAPAK